MKYIILFFAISFSTYAATAQTRTSAATKTARVKLFTSLGQFKDSISLSPEQILTIIDQPIVIVDDKKAVYQVSSYTFVYKRIGVSETEDGKAIPATSIASQLFTKTPLPEIWTTTIKEQLRKGEQLQFLEVIVKDAKGKVLQAPNLKITVL